MDFFLGIWDAIDKALIRENRYEFYLSGIGNTLLISLFAVILGFLIGAFVAVVKQLCAGRRGIGWIAKICDLYVFVIRGTPVLVQLLLINAVLFNYRGANAIVAAVLCFGINRVRMLRRLSVQVSSLSTRVRQRQEDRWVSAQVRQCGLSCFRRL